MPDGERRLQVDELREGGEGRVDVGVCERAGFVAGIGDDLPQRWSVGARRVLGVLREHLGDVRVECAPGPLADHRPSAVNAAQPVEDDGALRDLDDPHRRPGRPPPWPAS